MKKIRLLWYIGLSVFVLCLSGCGGEKTYGIQPPIKGLRWGMSLEEVENVLGKDYTLEKTGEADDESYRYETLCYKEAQKVYGQDAQVTVIMAANPEERYYQDLPEKYLLQISLIYEPEEGKKVLEELNKEYGPSEENYWGLEGTTVYKSAQTAAEIEDERLKEKLQTVTEQLGLESSLENMNLGYIVTFEDASELMGTEGCAVWIVGERAVDVEAAKRAIDK